MKRLRNIFSRVFIYKAQRKIRNYNEIEKKLIPSKKIETSKKNFKFYKQFIDYKKYVFIILIHNKKYKKVTITEQ